MTAHEWKVVNISASDMAHDLETIERDGWVVHQVIVQRDGSYAAIAHTNSGYEVLSAGTRHTLAGTW